MQALQLQGLHHIARVTHDVAASQRFYVDLLGFRPIERPPFDFRGAWLLGYGLQIHIIERRQKVDREADTPIDTRANHLAFAVQDHGPVKKRLDELGIRYHEQVNAGGIPQIFIQDPDGNHIEIGIYPPHPPYLDEA